MELAPGDLSYRFWQFDGYYFHLLREKRLAKYPLMPLNLFTNTSNAATFCWGFFTEWYEHPLRTDLFRQLTRLLSLGIYCR